jgi:hypothetical protein
MPGDSSMIDQFDERKRIANVSMELRRKLSERDTREKSLERKGRKLVREVSSFKLLLVYDRPQNSTSLSLAMFSISDYHCRVSSIEA